MLKINIFSTQVQRESGEIGQTSVVCYFRKNNANVCVFYDLV